jgi:imidazolonepropionase-like amidohydrolase
MQGPSDTDTRSPHVRAAGPLLTTFDHWLNLPAERQFIYLTSDSVARAGVRYLKTLGSSAVKVWFIVRPGSDLAAMERMVTAAGDEARRVGLPLIVHATGLAEAKAALRAGANLLVHSVWDLPVDTEFLRLARRNHTLYGPTLTVADGYRRLYEAARAGRAPEIDDPCHAVDSLTRARVSGDLEWIAQRMRAPSIVDPKLRAERVRTMAANLMTVRRNGIPIAMGTDAGNPLTLHGAAVFAEMDAMHAAGLSPMEVLVASTRNGARAMGALDRFGTLEPGKDADLVLLGADPTRDVRAWRSVRYVVRGGVIRSQDELRAP